MASIPLPALQIRANAESPLDTIGKIQGLRAMQQQQQMQQLQQQKEQIALADQQASTKAMKEWDGKDINELPPLILKNGGSANAVFGAKQTITKLNQEAATADEATLKNQATKNDLIAGHLEAVKTAPVEQKQQAYSAAMQDLTKKGFIKQGQLPDQYPGDDQLAQAEKTFMGQKAIVDQELEKRKTSATELTANARAMSSQTAADEFKAKMDPTSPMYAPSNSAVAMGTAPGATQIKAGEADQAGKKSAAEAQAKQPIDVQTEVLKQLALQKMAPAALGNVKPSLIGPATAAYTKAGEDYAGAVQSAQNLSDFIKEAKSGNKEAVKIVPLQGALEITTAQGVHRINRTEVDQYGGAGSLYDRLAGKVGGTISGKDIPDNVLNDMDALQKQVAQNATILHANKVATINQAYGSKFEPMNFGDGGAQGGGSFTAPSGASTATGPNGHKIVAVGGKWVDAKTGQPIQ